ncbi:phosphatidylserine decarboxylase [Nocardia nova]|nr:phosphatidylserine decarboxylase [Nocardia nova]
MAKGDEFGYFTFGGSDIILLFQKASKSTSIP